MENNLQYWQSKLAESSFGTQYPSLNVSDVQICLENIRIIRQKTGTAFNELCFHVHNDAEANLEKFREYGILDESLKLKAIWKELIKYCTSIEKKGGSVVVDFNGSAGYTLHKMKLATSSSLSTSNT